MDTHQIKRVHQLPAYGVCTVVAEGEFILIQHQAAGTGSLVVGVATRTAGVIYLGQEFGYGLRHGVCSAEGSDESALCQWITLLLGCLFTLVAGPARLRPEGRVAPIRIAGQHFVRLKPGLILHLKYKLGV